MSSPFGTNNPGIGGLDELTVDEEALLTALGTGVLNLVETTAPSAEPGYGKLYTKASDSKLYFLNDSGVEFDLTAGGGGGGTGITWSEETTTSATMAVNNGYIANNASRVTLTLPDTAAIGSIVRVAGKGAGGWRIAQNAGETIYYGVQQTTTGTSGYLESNHRRDSIELVCITANTDWQVISAVGNVVYN